MTQHLNGDFNQVCPHLQMNTWFINKDGVSQYNYDEHTWIIKWEDDEEEYNCVDDKGHEEVFETFEEALMWCKEPEDDTDSDSD